MIFKLHYWFMASGANALGLLLGVFVGTYTDASSTEIGSLYMLMPLISLIFRPMICAMADRAQSHQKYMMRCLVVVALSYAPFVVIPLLGPSVYEQHPRLCWYSFVAFKVIGDIAFSGANSLGDSLAVNYAKRIGTDFSVYRVWATVSWMTFGLITGQINEIWFLPKYVPGFMILISASLLNALVVWLWPPEYFIMVPLNETATPKNSKLQQQARPADQSQKKGNAFTRSLLPRDVVWAHIKGRLKSLVTCSCFSAPTSHGNAKRAQQQPEKQGQPAEPANGATGHARSDTKSSYAAGDLTKIADDKMQTQAIATRPEPGSPIDKAVQFKILMHLLKRDPRIFAYLSVFTCAGFGFIPVSFLFMQLSEICHSTNRCNFSQLGGLLQFSMASIEAILFVYITRIIRTVGRLNTIAFSFLVVALKFSFYATIWPQVNPYFSILAEMPTGLIYAIFLTLTVEMAYLFANEVEYILPELIEAGAIDADADREKLKLSLSATMQALVSSASEGIGRGMGALIYGLILDAYSFQTLWLIVAVGGSVLFGAVVLVNLLDGCFKFELGLDVAHQKQQRRQLASIQQAENGQIAKASDDTTAAR